MKEKITLRKNRPVLITALNFLEIFIKQNGTTKQYPRIMDLAKMAGVSYVTMWKALQIFRENGLITLKPHRGIVVNDERTSILDMQKESIFKNDAPTKYERICNQIEQDILKRAFSELPYLPSMKNLKSLFGASTPTITKALRLLQKRKIIRCDQRRYRIVSEDNVNTRMNVILIASGDKNGNIQLSTPRTETQLRALEQECSRNNLNLQMICFDDITGTLYVPDQVKKLLHSEKTWGSLLGFILWQVGIDKHDWWSITHNFTKYQKPIALLDESGEREVPLQISQIDSCRIFSLGYSHCAGYRIGKFLADNGHKCIAYISPIHNALWSRNRFNGLQKAFDEIGLQNAVNLFSFNKFTLPKEISEHSKDISTLRENMKNWKITDTKIADSIEKKLNDLLIKTAYKEYMNPIMDQALKHQTITAWVAADDDTALPCLEFLKEKRNEVPKDISVVGLDDSIDGFFMKLTSYNYNSPSYMQAIIRFLTDYKISPRKSTSSPTIEIDGYIVLRDTVCKVI